MIGRELIRLTWEGQERLDWPWIQRRMIFFSPYESCPMRTLYDAAEAKAQAMYPEARLATTTLRSRKGGIYVRVSMIDRSP